MTSVRLAKPNFSIVSFLADRVAIVSTVRVGWRGAAQELDKSPDLIDRYLAAGVSG